MEFFNIFPEDEIILTKLTYSLTCKISNAIMRHIRHKLYVCIKSAYAFEILKNVMLPLEYSWNIKQDYRIGKIFS